MAVQVSVSVNFLLISFITNPFNGVNTDEQMHDEGVGVSLNFVKLTLEEFAPTSLAESWDNVGLLLDQVRPQMITKILLTNDLTEDVMDEALLISAGLIISYHPPIFTPLKRITNAEWKERIVSRCLANNVAIYSPHTSWDVVHGGVNDWLTSAFECSIVKPVVSRKSGAVEYTITIETTNNGLFNDLKSQLPPFTFFQLLSEEPISNSSNSRRLTIRCRDDAFERIVLKLQNTNHQVNFENSLNGAGRVCTLIPPISIRDAVNKLKKHIGVPFLQLALARNTTPESLVQTIAFAAGSGMTLLRNAASDLKVVGEAGHHDILNWVHKGTSVVVTHHSNSERGFLHKFKEALTSLLNNTSVEIVVSIRDVDPLQTV